MGEKSDIDLILENMPFLNVWYKVLLLYIFQISIFFIAIVFFWWISSKYLFGAIIAEFIVVTCGTIPFVYSFKNNNKIRERYLDKYGKLAFHHFWLHYHSFTVPLLSISLYFPLLLINYDFLPRIIELQSNFITNSIFSFYISIPLSLLIVIFGFLLRYPSGNYETDMAHFLLMIYPEKGKLITDGVYRFIRHPRFLCRIIFVTGFCIFANSLLAFGVGLIHILAFLSILKLEDNELKNRLGKDVEKYQKEIPALIPKIGNWRKYMKFVLKRGKT